jgi:hypothetical protein
VLHRPGADRGGRVGVANRSRQEAATALSGFQFATARSQPGIPWVGTKAFETNDRGRKTMNPMAWAASGLARSMPAHAPAQVMAKAMRRDEPIAPNASGWAQDHHGIATQIDRRTS